MDLDTAKLTSYSCWEQLTGTDDEIMAARKKYNAISTWSGLLMRLLPSYIVQDPATHIQARQRRVFEHLWVQDNYHAKRMFAQFSGSMFACGYNIEKDSEVALIFNASICCLAKRLQRNWMKSPTCQWSLSFIAKNTLGARLEIGTAAITLIVLRLSASVLDCCLQRGVWWQKWQALWQVSLLILIGLSYILCVRDIGSDSGSGYDGGSISTPLYSGRLTAPAFCFLQEFQCCAALAVISDVIFSIARALDLKCLRRSESQKFIGVAKASFPSALRLTVFWVLITMLACQLSFALVLRPAVRNDIILAQGITVRSAMFGNAIWHLSSNLVWGWAFLMFMLISHICFGCYQTLAGLAIGKRRRVGAEHSWSQFQNDFQDLRGQLEQRLDTSYAKSASRTRLRLPSFTSSWGTVSDRSTLQSPLLDDAVELTTLGTHQPTAQALENIGLFFATVWNKFVDKLRCSDLISDYESALYKCLVLPGNDVPLQPILVTLDGVRQVIEFVDAQSLKFNRMRHNTIKDAEQLDSQTLRELKQSQAWTRMHEKMLSDIAHKESFSGARDALQQVTQLTMFIFCEALGHHQVGQSIHSPHANELELAQFEWLSAIGCGHHQHLHEWPAFLRNLTHFDTHYTNGKRQYRCIHLRDAIEALARGVTEQLCYPPDGLSMQPGYSFSRRGKRWSGHHKHAFEEQGFRGAVSVGAMRKLLQSILTQVKDLCSDLPVPSYPRNVGIPEFISEPHEAEQRMVSAIDRTLQCSDGFFGDDGFAEEKMERLANNVHVYRAAECLLHLLCTLRNDSAPRCAEAQRRILTFASSLHMKMPMPKAVASMRSITTLTPFYSEDVVYSRETITSEPEGRPCWCMYLKAIHEEEWENMFERLGLQMHQAKEKRHLLPAEVWERGADARASTMEIEVTLWASLRGQTLARAVFGTMQNEEALNMFAKREHCFDAELAYMPSPAARCLVTEDRVPQGAVWRSDPIWMRESHQKYGYVISCMIYGDWVRKKRSKADTDKKRQIDLLLKIFPHLRVAYTDSVDGKFFSCLARWDNLAAPDEHGMQISEIYRVQTPGHILVGEGKPENENHAMIFTRGEYLQVWPS